MPIRTEQTKQQWQEKVSVAGRVLFFRCRQCILPPYQHGIYRLNARYPIAFYMTTMPLYIILSTDKIPHKISGRHMTYLITKEELQIVSKSRLLSLCQAEVLPVIRGMTTLFTMYTWENSLPVVGIICFFLCYSVAILVLAVDICPFMEIYRSGIKIFSFEQWL